MTPYTIHPDTTILLSPRYYGSIAWYAAMARHEHCIVDYTARYNKRQKLTHRCTIADVNGPLDLTMPLVNPAQNTLPEGTELQWRHIRLSQHGEWWNVHRVAFESAYGRTPFFEYYIDRFLPVLTPGVVDHFETLEKINRYIDTQVRQLLYLPGDTDTPSGHVTDMRGEEPALDTMPPYYQVRAGKLGFIPGLSILDLLFNLGPEACLYLQTLNTKTHTSQSNLT